MRAQGRIFISPSSVNNAAALAVAKWLADNGWDDYFLDVAPRRGLAPGERWQEALKAAADRCEAVLFLISPAWRDSSYCRTEFQLAKLLGKTIFGPPAFYAVLSPFVTGRPEIDLRLVRLAIALLQGASPLLVFALMRVGGASVSGWPWSRCSVPSLSVSSTFLVPAVAIAAGLGAEQLTRGGSRGALVALIWVTTFLVQILLGVLRLQDRFEIISVIMESPRWTFPFKL